MIGAPPMKSKSTLLIIIIVVLVIAVAVVYNIRQTMVNNESTIREINNSSNIVVKDALGRDVVLDHPANKIIVTDDEIAELVQLLGVADKVVGIEPSIKSRGYFPLMADKPVVGSQFRGLNYELIAELKPDLVILMNVGPVGKIISELDKIGVKSIVISVKPQDIPYTMRLLGKVLGEEEKAEKLIDWWNEKWRFLEERLGQLNTKTKLKVFVGMGFKPTERLPTRTWGKLAKWNYILDKLHMENIAAEKLDKSGELDLEYIAQANPDIIIIGDWSDNWVGYTKDNASLAREIIEHVLNDPVLKDTNAVKNKQVYVIHYVMLGSFRSVIGAYYLAKTAYPDLLRDIDPEELNKEYFEKLLGVPYRGVWFYPKPWLKEG